jgi:hypothetical protein
MGSVTSQEQIGRPGVLDSTQPPASLFSITLLHF